MNQSFLTTHFGVSHIDGQAISRVTIKTYITTNWFMNVDFDSFSSEQKQTMNHVTFLIGCRE